MRFLEIKNKVLQKLNDSQRYTHSLLVAQKAEELVKVHQLNVDPDTAYLAGLVHDYAKKSSLEDYIEVVKEYNLDIRVLEEPFPLLHAFLGIYIIKDELGILDVELLKAIYYHPTGSKEMSQLAEVLFLADFIEESRTYEICVKTRNISKENFLKAVATKIEYLLQNEAKAHRYTLEAFEKYKKYLKE